jgi:plasmid stabilization system protein ParE
MERAIERRLLARRERLAEHLDIGLEDQEWRSNPPDYPKNPDLSAVERYFLWRKTATTEGRRVHRIDLAMEELAGELRRCWALLRDVNRAGSSAQVYGTLQVIEASPRAFADLDALYRIEPETRALIEDYYPGGWIALEQAPIDAEALSQAVRDALASISKPGRGRPHGTKDFAGERLAIGLATIYAEYREPPVRRVLVEHGIEYGPFKNFVEDVVSIIPRRLRRTGKGAIKSVDHLVRIGVEHIKQPRPHE